MKKRIESGTSLTAIMTCLMRVLSYYEKNKMLRTDDYIAPFLIPPFLNSLARQPVFRNIYKFLAPKGIYEYIIARTKYIDEVFENNKSKIEQVVILGAGFDTRSIRFRDKLRQAVFYELDSPITQESKLKRYEEKNVISQNVVYIPIDFTKEAFSQRLSESGFQKGKVCLFLLEGLSMYLNTISMDKTFDMISDCAGAGSMVVFDYVYASVLRREDTYTDERKISKMVSVFGEKWSFGIERGEAGNFLSKHGFMLRDEADSRTLEKRYFSLSGKKRIHVHETHSIVTAGK